MNAATNTALIVDDERDIRELIALTLDRIGIDSHTAANLDEARHLLATYAFDVCLTDMRLPDGSGLELVRHVQTTYPTLPVAVITAHGNVEAAVEAMKGGAFDFLSKPVDIGRLRRIVVQAVGTEGGREHRRTCPAGEPERSLGAVAAANEADAADSAARVAPDPVAEADRLKTTEHGRLESLETLSGQKVPPRVDDDIVGGERLIGRSAPMRELRHTIRKVARTNAPVWITGESGTGKELIARLIHENGPRAEAPFVAINCGAIPAELMESELFGHRKGAFTGAVADSEGLFRRAEGGTLFLDEVVDLPLHMQVKLLRAIQERAVRPVGGTEEIAIDARVLSASHADLAAEVDAGRFRHDLYYRLNVISVRAPSLRERSDDIASLARHVLGRIGDAADRARLAPAALERLESYHFPGNVRELENLLERAVAMADGNVIDADDLILRPAPGVVADPPRGTPERRGSGSDEERGRLLDALETARWNRKSAAKAVGLTYRQFRYRLAQYGIEGPGGRR